MAGLCLCVGFSHHRVKQLLEIGVISIGCVTHSQVVKDGGVVALQTPRNTCQRHDARDQKLPHRHRRRTPRFRDGPVAAGVHDVMDADAKYCSGGAQHVQR